MLLNINVYIFKQETEYNSVIDNNPFYIALRVYKSHWKYYFRWPWQEYSGIICVCKSGTSLWAGLPESASRSRISKAIVPHAPPCGWHELLLHSFYKCSIFSLALFLRNISTNAELAVSLEAVSLSLSPSVSDWTLLFATHSFFLIIFFFFFSYWSSGDFGSVGALALWFQEISILAFISPYSLIRRV